MRKNDARLLEALERIYRCLEQETAKLKDVKTASVDKLREMSAEARGYARMLEEISPSGRMIMEYALELQKRHGLVAVETETVTQGFAPVRKARVEEFGLLRLNIGEVRLSWKDGYYSYLIYPDKVEMRAPDEKTAIKLFFSRPFDKQFLRNCQGVATCANLVYLHPELAAVLEQAE
jgi:hypothetical protein